MTTVKKAANAIGGKTARACDSCLRKRARWYCAADDAFLCQGCDTSVHSANRLASQHERTRLQTSFLKRGDSGFNENSPPAWHQGFTRKARTPRHAKPTAVQQSPKGEKNNINPFPLVPEIGSEEASLDEEEQLLCRVPIFDPFATELYEAVGRDETVTVSELALLLTDNGHGEACDLDLQGFLPSEMELAEFAADVESLLGGVNEETHKVDEFELIDSKEDGVGVCFDSYRVKVEDEEVEALIASHLDPYLDVAKETINWNLSGEFVTGEDEMEEKVFATEEKTMISECKAEIKRKIFLRLNYEKVISAWSSHGSPWTTGTRPNFNPDDCLPDFVGACNSPDAHHQYEGMGVRMGRGDGEREARVSRYREKRRTRLFSKKIRYEVRKLNAEKRPRIKGRFVRRASFAGPAFTCLMNK